MERAIKASSVEWPREIPPTPTPNGERRMCERADSGGGGGGGDSIEKRAMGGAAEETANGWAGAGGRAQEVWF